MSKRTAAVDPSSAAARQKLLAYVERRRRIRLLSHLAAYAAFQSPAPTVLLYQCVSGNCGRCHFCKWPQSIPVAFRR